MEQTAYATAPPVLYELSGVGKSCEGPAERITILKYIDLTVRAGESLAIVGASGSGKSTLLHLLGALDTPTAGKVLFEGKSLPDMTPEEKAHFRNRKLGFGFQFHHLLAEFSAFENVCIPGLIGRRPRAEVERRAGELLDLVGLSARRDHKPGQLSGGQQQRCALARILASEPTAILLDEPFSALDSYLKYQLELELAETLGGFPGTVLWVSHDRGEVFRNCRRVCVIDRGRSQPVTTLGELFRSPGTEAAARLSGCKNYADARPREDAVFLPDWGLTLSCSRPVPEGVCRIGIRAHHVQLAGPGA